MMINLMMTTKLIKVEIEEMNCCGLILAHFCFLDFVTKVSLNLVWFYHFALFII
mgnify:CR=1 FL=1